MAASNFFDYRFADSELQTRFERFIDNNVPELFSFFGRVNRTYTISWVQARSIVNHGGKIRDTLVALSNMINQPASNNSPYKNIHTQNIFLTMHLEANGNFQKLISLIRKFLRELPQEDYRYNVVWYSEYLPEASKYDL